MRERILGGLLGAIVGDALGVPVEFYKREILKKTPVVDMISGRGQNQVKGTWSDDSSMILCTVESLLNGLDYDDIGNNFVKWVKDGYWTPYGKMFGIGRGTFFSIGAIAKGKKAVEAGQGEEKFNGNGSLMRILPIAFYIKKNNISNYENIVKDLSSITHSHEISHNSCLMYIDYAVKLLEGAEKYHGYESMRSKSYCRINNIDLMDKFHRIFNDGLEELSEEYIDNSGYVVTTLEAAIWCFLRTDSYKECVLKAVNLGGDTDTIASIAGGLAGIYYGVDSIPKEWIDSLVKKEEILSLLNDFVKGYL